MFKSFTVNNDLKSHAILALVIAFWLVAFLIFISPFDVSDLSLQIRLILMPPYGLLFFISYMIGYGVQLLWFKQNRTWSLAKEVIIFLIIYFSCFLFCWLYYNTEWINGTYSLSEFAFNVFLPIGMILSVGLIFGRYFVNRRATSSIENNITLKGNNRQEILKITKADIIAVSGAQNYVDLHILEGGNYKKVVFRNTLKNVHSQCDWLVRVHRSFLVNTSHFTRWVDLNTANFSGVEIPVSKKYKEELNKRIIRNP